MSRGTLRRFAASVLPRRGIAAALVPVAAVALLAGCASGGALDAASRGPATNLSLLRDLVSGLGRAVIDSAGTGIRDTVMLDVDSSDGSWLVRMELARALTASGRSVVTREAGRAAPSVWTVRGPAVGVRYGNIRRNGIFARTVLDRVVSASISSEITSGGEVVFAGTTAGEAADTVDEGQIPELEAGAAAFRRGELPELRTIDRFVEPFVIIGATGAAIFLFFQVRS